MGRSMSIRRSPQWSAGYPEIPKLSRDTNAAAFPSILAVVDDADDRAALHECHAFGVRAAHCRTPDDVAGRIERARLIVYDPSADHSSDDALSETIAASGLPICCRVSQVTPVTLRRIRLIARSSSAHLCVRRGATPHSLPSHLLGGPSSDAYSYVLNRLSKSRLTDEQFWMVALLTSQSHNVLAVKDFKHLVGNSLRTLQVRLRHLQLPSPHILVTWHRMIGAEWGILTGKPVAEAARVMGFSSPDVLAAWTQRLLQASPRNAVLTHGIFPVVEAYVRVLEHGYAKAGS